uniref:EGF-like domain-containing protein n=1 Tax=Trichuris muris TaxID=70415 RepID=A0A5S6QLH0_TRIMR
MNIPMEYLSALFSILFLLFKAEAPKSCPFENNALNYRGYRIDNWCFTLVSEDESVKRQLARSYEPLLRIYCATNFKEGKLHYFNTKEASEANFWLTGNGDTIILNETNLTEANAFICSHRPYEDCYSYEESVCRFIKERNACFLQNVLHVEQEPEMPYGIACPNYTGSGLLRPCQCSTCKYSKWTAWNSFVDKNGHTVFTRYRPRSAEQWPCLADHKRCCAYIAVPKLGIRGDIPINEIMKKVSCAEGGRPVPELFHSKRCECEEEYNGVFCEIYIGGCVTHQCKNNGTCIDSQPGYRCKCKRGFAGDNCEIRMTDDEIKVAERSPYQHISITMGYIFCAAVLMFTVTLIIIKLIKPKLRRNPLLQMMLQQDDVTWSSEASDEDTSLMNSEETNDDKVHRAPR